MCFFRSSTNVWRDKWRHRYIPFGHYDCATRKYEHTSMIQIYIKFIFNWISGDIFVDSFVICRRRLMPMKSNVKIKARMIFFVVLI